MADARPGRSVQDLPSLPAVGPAHAMQAPVLEDDTIIELG
jgi:hypothetical protein